MIENRVGQPASAIEQLRRSLVRYADLVPCRNAFIDTRNPGSELKENFTIIGPGVSESTDQYVHISEPHGFNIGAARQPPDCVNSQHSHDTAEVFVVHTGEWTFNFGEEGDVKIHAGPGTVASMPTHLFRGFTNVGKGEGFLWVALGGDDPGRVLWAPKVFDMARDFGLVLLADGTLFDTADGKPLPENVDVMPRTTQAQISALQSPNHYSLRSCIIAPDDIGAQPIGLLQGQGVEERLLIGPGAPIDWPHGFTLSSLSLATGAQIDSYRHSAKEVWFIHAGALECQVLDGSLRVETGDTLSVPQTMQRGWRAIEETRAFVVRGGNQLPNLAG